MSLSSTYLSRKALIAENLKTKGVSSAKASDGLTTLAGKILEVNQSVNLTSAITCNAAVNEVLLNESVEFSATVSAGNGSILISDALVLFKSNDDEIVGYGVTDEDGVARFTYVMDNFFSFSVYAEFHGLVIEDPSVNISSCTSQPATVTCNYDLNVTSDKTILSFEDEESCTITGVLTNSLGNIVSDEPVDYEIKCKDNVLDSGSLVTDENGEISIDYDSAGLGDVDVIFSLRSILQKTYVIEDCRLYDDATTDRSSTYNYNGLTVSNNGSEYSVQCNTKDSVLNFINNVNNVSCELKIKFNNVNCGLHVSTDGSWDDQGYGELFYYSSESSKIYHYYSNEDNITHILNINKPLSASEWYTMRVKIENNDYAFSILDSTGAVVQTSSHNTSTIENKWFGLFCTRVGSTCYIKDIKVKAL